MSLFFFFFLNDSSISVASNGIHLNLGNKELYSVMFLSCLVAVIKMHY